MKKLISYLVTVMMVCTIVPCTAFATEISDSDNLATETVTSYIYVPEMDSGFSNKTISDMDKDDVDEVKYVIKSRKDVPVGIYKVVIENAEVNLLDKNNKVRLEVGQEGVNSDLIELKGDNKISIVMDYLPEDSSIRVELIPEEYITNYTKFSQKNFESGKWTEGVFKVGRDIPVGKYIALVKKGSTYDVDSIGVYTADSLYNLQNGRQKFKYQWDSLKEGHWVKVDRGLYRIIEKADTSKTLKISAAKMTMYVGTGTKQLKVTGPKNGKTVTWKSSNKKVATVNKYGTVIAKKAGKATVTAKVGNKTFKCALTVKNPVKYKYTRFTEKRYSKKNLEITNDYGYNVYDYTYTLVGGKDIPAGIYNFKTKYAIIDGNMGDTINRNQIEIRKNKKIEISVTYIKGAQDGYCTLIPASNVNSYTKYSISDMYKFNWNAALYKVGRDIDAGTYIDASVSWSGTKEVMNVAVADSLYGANMGLENVFRQKTKMTKAYKAENGKYYKGGQVIVLKNGQWIATMARIYRIK